jgi:hypothetical protein
MPPAPVPAPTLADVVGAIMVGLAEARSLGDRYSSELAALYERGELLRAFPVPRMEYASVDIDLPFAIRDVGGRPGATYDLIRAEASHVGEAARAAVGSDVTNVDTLGVAADAATGVALEELTIADVRAADGELSASAAGELRTRIVERATKTFIAALQLRNRDRTRILSERVTKALLPVVTAAMRDLAKSRKATGVTPATTVFVTAAELANIPPGSVARIKLTVNARNYEWTMVDRKDGEPVRKLVPE